VLTAIKEREETSSYLILTLKISVLISAKQLVRKTPHVRELSGKHQKDKDQESVTRGRILSSVDVSGILCGIFISNLDQAVTIYLTIHYNYI